MSLTLASDDSNADAVIQQHIVSAIARQTLPTLIPVKDTAWCTHTSLHGMPHANFESAVGQGGEDYERLEHLGDALLCSFVTAMIHSEHPRLVVGVRTSIRALLVQNSTLSLLSIKLGLIAYLRAGPAPLLGLKANEKVQADLFEAYLAAAALEHDEETVSKFLNSIYLPLLKLAYLKFRERLDPCAGMAVVVRQPVPQSTDEDFNPRTNYIGPLVEARRGGVSRKLDWTESSTGPSHLPAFTVTLKVTLPNGVEPLEFEGKASTKKRARNMAAYHACVLFRLA